MSASDELRLYVRLLRRRFRLGAIARGASVVAGAALLATLFLVIIINRFAFSSASLWTARAALLLLLAVGAVLGIAVPLWRLQQKWWTARAERQFPQFEQRLQTFAERDVDGRDPFIELLAADTLRVAQTADIKSAAPDRKLTAWFAAGILCLGMLVWLIVAGPGYLGYGTRALWAGAPATPFYDIHVTPGDVTIGRHADQIVTAEVIGTHNGDLRIHARYQSASKWEEAVMQPQPAAAGFQFLFAGVPEDVEYYVQTGAVESAHFHLRVADIPHVKQIRVTYHYPDWTKASDVVEPHGGDLRAVEGTEARLEIVTDRAVANGILSLEDGKQVALTAAGTNVYRASITLRKNDTYHVASSDQAHELRLSEDYFIEAQPVKPPEVAVSRPVRDYRASPIEEVTIAAKASDPYGLSEFTLRYSVNGRAEKSVNLIKQPGSQSASASTVINLEPLKLVPGDVVGFYAMAKDARSDAHTDISFIQIEPYEREFSQSQQSGGGGGGGGGAADNQSQIAEREKEIIAATWKQNGLKSTTTKEAAEQAKFLSDVQNTLRIQSLSLAGRLEMRDLQFQNEQFNGFQKDMHDAAVAMGPATRALQEQDWVTAVSAEQKALQHLLRAEATFRQIEVAFGSRGGGGGAVNSAGRDLASLFDLELDTQKNQYESAKAPSEDGKRSEEIDEALRKLDALARRQTELAAQAQQSAQSAEERWQQEMLRRQAEELQKQMEQLARNSEAGGGASSGTGRGQPNGKPGAKGEQTNAQQALDRVRQAEDNMRRAVDEHNGSEARRAADQLREAMNLLGGLQQQDASARADSMVREAGRIADQQREQAERLKNLIRARSAVAQTGSDARSGGLSDQRASGRDAIERFIDDRQKLADDLARLEDNVRAAEKTAREHDTAAASKFRDALGDLDGADTETHLQRSADLLRRGYGPITDAAEDEFRTQLQHLSEQLADARQAMSNAPPPADGALDSLGRLRSRLAALEQTKQPGKSGQGQGEGSQQGDGRQAGAGAQAGTSGDVGGQLAGRAGGGAANGPINGASNTGVDPGGTQARTGAPVIGPTRNGPDAPTPEIYRAQMKDLGELRRSVAENPEARRQVDELIRQMQRLDPKRFPGNPAMVEELYASALTNVDRLELQLRRAPDADQPPEVRSDTPPVVPPNYQAAVAEYFRRLSKTL